MSDSSNNFLKKFKNLGKPKSRESSTKSDSSSISGSSNEINILKLEIEQLTNEKEMLIKQNRKYENEAALQTQMALNEKNERYSFENINKELRKELSKVQKELTDLKVFNETESKQQHLNVDVSELSEQIQKQNEYISQLNQTISEYETQKDDLQLSNKMLINDNNALKDQYEYETSGLRSSVNNLTTTNTQLMSENELIKKDLKTLQGKFERSITDLEKSYSDIGELNETLENMKNENLNSQVYENGHKALLPTKSQDQFTLYSAESNTQMDDEVSAVNQTIRQLELENKESIAALESTKLVNEKNLVVIAELQNSLKIKEDTIINLKGELLDMKEKIDNLSKENSQQLTSLEKSNLEIQSLQAAKLENENVNDKERLAMEKLVGELQQIIDGKEIEIRDLKMKLSELEVATAGDKSNIIKLEEKIQKLMDDNKKQLAKLSAKESEFEKLRIPQNEIPGVHNTQEQLQEKEKLITRLNIDIEKLEHEKKDLLEKSNSNKHEVERLEAELELAKPNHEAGDKDDSGRDAYEAELLNTIKLKDMEIEELENQLDNATLSLEQLHSECETLRVDRVTDADFKLLEEDLEWTKKQLELAEEALEKEKKRKGSVQKSVSFAPSVPSTLEAPLRTTSLHRLHSSLPEGIEALKADQTNMTELEKKYYDACFSLQAYNVQLKYKIEMLETQIEEMVDEGYEDSDGDYTDSEGEEEGKETPKDTTSIPPNNKSDEPLQRTSTGIFGLW